MKVWVGLEQWAYESYEGRPTVFLSEEVAKAWESDGPGPYGDSYWREVYEVEAK